MLSQTFLIIEPYSSLLLIFILIVFTIVQTKKWKGLTAEQRSWSFAVIATMYVGRVVLGGMVFYITQTLTGELLLIAFYSVAAVGCGYLSLRYRKLSLTQGQE